MKKVWSKEMLAKEAKKYASRSQFHDANTTAHAAASKMGILNEICAHMPQRNWTILKLKEEALKYRTRTEFSKGSEGAYKSALKKGILDEICAHMEIKRVSWSEKMIQNEALKYLHRVDFQRGSSGAYQAAANRKILNKVCEHMVPKVKKWTFDEIQKEASKYSNRTEFLKFSCAAHTAARRMKVMDKVCEHMDLLWEPIWNKDSVIKEAKRYKFKNDFHKNSPSAYSAAKKMGIYDEITKHMENGRIKWTTKTIANEAKKYKYRIDFIRNSGGAYAAAISLGILDKVCSHMKVLYNGYYHCVYSVTNNKKAYIGITSQRFELRVAQHKKKNNPTNSREISLLPDTKFTQITDYEFTADEIKSGIELKYINKYRDMGYTILNNISNIGNIGYSRPKWTKKRLKEEALKYNSRGEFLKNSPGAVNAASYRGWIEEICEHMEYPDGYWTKGRIISHIKQLKYKNISDIKKKKPRIYDEILKHKIMDDIQKLFI